MHIPKRYHFDLKLKSTVPNIGTKSVCNYNTDWLTVSTIFGKCLKWNKLSDFNSVRYWHKSLPVTRLSLCSYHRNGSRLLCTPSYVPPPVTAQRELPPSLRQNHGNLEIECWYLQQYYIFTYQNYIKIKDKLDSLLFIHAIHLHIVISVIRIYEVF